MSFSARRDSWLLLGMLSTLLMGCDTPCENVVNERVISPDKSFQAVWFSRNCGATTGSNSQVSVVPATDADVQDSGNVLVLNESSPLRMHWRSERELVITGADDGAAVIKKNAAVAGISVVYE